MYDYKGVVMITLDASNVTPLYIQLADLIKSSIQQGKIGYGEQIPTEFQLSEQYTVSRNTVRRAIRVLEKENHIIVAAYIKLFCNIFRTVDCFKSNHLGACNRRAFFNRLGKTAHR